MEKTLLALATLAAMAVPAWATMPLLGEKPPIRTDAACWAWAEEQAKDEEVAFMWGILDEAIRTERSRCADWPTIASASPSPKSWALGPAPASIGIIAVVTPAKKSAS